jgi:hypothetical protein
VKTGQFRPPPSSNTGVEITEGAVRLGWLQGSVVGDAPWLIAVLAEFFGPVTERSFGMPDTNGTGPAHGLWLVDTDTWLSSSSSRHIFHGAGTAAAVEVRLDTTDSAPIISLSDGPPVSLGPAGARLDNAAPLKIGTVSPAAFHNLVVMTGSNVLVLNVAGIPTANPNVAGQVWSDAGTLKVSAG